MAVTNLVIVPAVMVFALTVVPVENVHAAGLLVFSMAAGAPFLIKLTQVSRNDLALGATVLMVLMVATVVVLPVVLPLVLDGIEVDASAIVRSLVGQMILPMLVGMATTQWAEPVAAVAQPWVARLSNVALYGLVVALLVGHAPDLPTSPSGGRCWSGSSCWPWGSSSAT